MPEALTEGQTLEDALELTKDALETALEFYFEDEYSVPMPSVPTKGIGRLAANGQRHMSVANNPGLLRMIAGFRVFDCKPLHLAAAR